MLEEHDQKVGDINKKLVNTQAENAQYQNQVKELKKQIEVLAEKNETFQDVSEMQTDEIERLRNLPEEKKKLLDQQ